MSHLPLMPHMQMVVVFSAQISGSEWVFVVFMQHCPTLGLFLLITHNDFPLVSQC